MSLVKTFNKATGVTYVYESESYWDAEKKQSRSRRKLVGKLDENGKDEICKLKAQLDRDGTTSGIPTSKTPINKDKRISNVNSREKSGKAKGGQPGHVKASEMA